MVWTAVEDGGTQIVDGCIWMDRGTELEDRQRGRGIKDMLACVCTHTQEG